MWKLYLTDVVKADSAMICGPEEYFAGGSCNKSYMLSIRRDVTPRLIIPIKARLQDGFEWTFESWIYLVQNASCATTCTALGSLEGDMLCSSIGSMTAEGRRNHWRTVLPQCLALAARTHHHPTEQEELQ